MLYRSRREHRPSQLCKIPLDSTFPCHRFHGMGYEGCVNSQLTLSVWCYQAKGPSPAQVHFTQTGLLSEIYHQKHFSYITMWIICQTCSYFTRYDTVLSTPPWTKVLEGSIPSFTTNSGGKKNRCLVLHWPMATIRGLQEYEIESLNPTHTYGFERARERERKSEKGEKKNECARVHMIYLIKKPTHLKTNPHLSRA